MEDWLCDEDQASTVHPLGMAAKQEPGCQLCLRVTFIKSLNFPETQFLCLQKEGRESGESG
jgi:hypothetical protein